MKSGYSVLPAADRDLDDIADYFATKESSALGLRFLSAAQTTFALLARQPATGWQCQMKHPALANTKLFPVSGFERILVYYRPFRSHIEILRVLHGARDLEALFAP